MLRTCVSLLIASAAMAAEPSAQEQARTLVRSAKAEFDSGQFEKAAQLLGQAVELAPTPATLFNLGRAREKAGQLEGAVEAYRRYLEVSPDAKDRGATQVTMDALTKRIEDKRRLETLEAQPPTIIVAPPPPPLFGRPRPGQVLLAGLGVAGVIAGVVLGVSASSSHAIAAQADVDVLEALPIQQRAQGLALGANLAYAIGGAVLLAGVLWWLFGGHA